MAEDKIKVRVLLTKDFTFAREALYEVDPDEFAEWSGGEAPTCPKVKEFIEAGRDRDEIEDRLWNTGNRIDLPSPETFVEINSVEVLGG